MKCFTKAGAAMSIDFDIQMVKRKAERFTPKWDKIAAAVQLIVCFAGVVLVMLHEANNLNSNKSKKK